MMTILDIRNRCVEEYEVEEDDKEKEKLGFAIDHFDDLIITVETSALGSSEHKRYFK